MVAQFQVLLGKNPSLDVLLGIGIIAVLFSNGLIWSLTFFVIIVQANMKELFFLKEKISGLYNMEMLVLG